MGQPLGRAFSALVPPSTLRLLAECTRSRYTHHMNSLSSRPQPVSAFPIWWLLLVAIVLGLLAVGLTRWQHDRRLAAIAAALATYPLPPDTERLQQTTHIGALVGLHDHCDYAVEQTLATRGAPADIAAFYRTATLPPINGTEQRLSITATIAPGRSADGRILIILRVIAPNQPKGLDVRCS